MICFLTFLITIIKDTTVYMKFREYIETHHVFTSTVLTDVCGNAASVKTALSRAVADGKVFKVRNGLYVSDTGRFVGVAANPYAVAAAFAPDALFSYHSALELHGLAHSVSRRVQFCSGSSRLSFSFHGTDFERYPTRDKATTDTVRADSFGSVSVTSREQTFIDCMAHMRLCSGAEEVLHSLAGLPYLDLKILSGLLEEQPTSVVARAGWYLEANAERWSVTVDYLEALHGSLPAKASYYLDSTSRKQAQTFAARWKLNLPVSLSELESWMEL
ncbi:MAG: hypothetical protein JJE36_05675 [Coriobacteriia bacterium]|nr:hypothetical protein [Coriobacteriia bacterium]